MAEQVFLQRVQKNSQPKNILLVKRHDLIYMEYKGDYLLTTFAKKPIFLHNLLELNEELLSI